MITGDRPGVVAQLEIGLASEDVLASLTLAPASTVWTVGGEASEEIPEKPWQDAEPPENLTDELAGETGEPSASGSSRPVAAGGVNAALDFPTQVLDDPIRIYLQEIARVKLLSARDEVDQAVAIERGTEAERQIELLAVANPELRRQLAATVERGEVARRCLTEANLRLVVSIARRYLNRGVALLDLFQEGNLGLLRAVGKFDYTLGYKFSTYATWWIRQAISRAVADQARTIRLPVHIGESLGKVSRASRRLAQELGREPTAEEIGAELELPAAKVEWILRSAQEALSLQAPVGEDEEARLGDFVEDRVAEAPAVTVEGVLLRELVADVLGSLPARERRVLELRFGIRDSCAHTLEEVGQELGVSRERIRQIEAKALRKLRHPSRSRWLREYAE